MNTIQITDKLNQALVDYLSTTFDVNKDGKNRELAYEIRQSFERPGALFNGPFLELIHPFKTDLSISQLVKKDILSDKLTDLSCFKLDKPQPVSLDLPLYTHQVKAISKICSENRSIVISAGTGSGKTECFSFPIVNDLLTDNTPGVRAILVYPLNALVNDQLDRLRVILAGTDITFGRFTGELPPKANREVDTLPNEIISRDEIRNEGRMPQILITNYAMLEYLLLRPEDSILFQSGLWKYLVLDEAHIYSGAQGIEVSMLIRRLKERLSKKQGDMICIATSATLVNDNVQSAIEFAGNLFGESFEEDDIIFGETTENKPLMDFSKIDEIDNEVYLHPEFDNLLEALRSDKPDVDSVALWMNQIDLISDAELSDAEHYLEDLPLFLFQALKNNNDILRFRKWMIEHREAVHVRDAARAIFPQMDDQNCLEALFHLIELGSLARLSKNDLPLIPAKYHLFARPPQGIWVCINPSCPEKNSEDDNDKKWSAIYSTPHETCDSCGTKVYPIYLCRQCGQIFIAAQQSENTLFPLVNTVVQEQKKQYFTWNRIEENLFLADELEEGDEQLLIRDKYQQNERRICLNCCKDEYLCNCNEKILSIPLFDLQVLERVRNARRIVPVEQIEECPRCGSKAKKDTEIVTSISIFGTAPLANLTYELYRQLPKADNDDLSKLPGGGRKMLTFYDSRQGAARFAAFLQDVANKQNYRHIVPKAIDIYKSNQGYQPAFQGLVDQSTMLALENKIIQNDPDAIPFWRRSFSRLSREERAEATKWVSAHILGEITTGSRQRQSLESLGLIGINYFEDDTPPDFGKLAQQISLEVNQVQALIGFLLDDLRYQKVVKLPPYIDQDDPVFGPHKGNARIIRQGNINYGEVRWIGATTRQRRRKYIELVLERNKLDSSESAVIQTLTSIWDWLIEETDIFEGSSSDGYRIRPERFFFDTDFEWYQCKRCQRLTYRGNFLPCPFLHCGGDLEIVDISSIQNKNYYYKLFKENLIPIRVEEHTAQLDPKKGKEYQDNFKKGNINVLSCSTTFELGIDLGDLQTVTMNNVPPTVANYRQRSGRAGRRTSGTAYILTWASSRPHDQAYFSNPAEIINGDVAIPRLFLENEFILRRHINAILLSMFLRYRQNKGEHDLKNCGSFFDSIYQENPQISYIDEWIQEQQAEILASVSSFSRLLNSSEKILANNNIENFKTELHRVNTGFYQAVTGYYVKRIQELANQSGDTAISKVEFTRINEQQNYYRKLLERMRKESLINYLSNRGFLPSYSFPLHTVELLLPKEARHSEHLRLERDLIQAIREYAPGSEIVADKRIWRSAKPLFWKDTVKAFAYRICGNCHHLEVSEEAGIPLSAHIQCPICGSSDQFKQKEFVVPDGFLADSKSGKPAKQYVAYGKNQMRSAIKPLKNFDEEQIGNLINVAYEREGKILYVNEGIYGKKMFDIELKGFSFGEEEKGNKRKVALGHQQTTDTLHIRFDESETVKVPSPNDRSFWLSLMYAIIHAAGHALQIERRDIDGVLSPRKIGDSWIQTIVLYDNVPGGAGHVKNIRDRFVEVINDAIRVLNCTDCDPETSCQHCLRDYNNQLFHYELVREGALKFLEAVSADINPLIDELPGSGRVVSANVNMWLLRKIENTQSSLDIAVPNLDLDHPLGENYSWFDTINDLLKKDCRVTLYLLDLPDFTPKGLSIAKQLQVLLDKGINLWKVNLLPEWQILIDTDDIANNRAIRSDEDKPIYLGENIGVRQLITTTKKEGTAIIEKGFSDLEKQQVVADDLKPPKDVKVINLHSSPTKYITEMELFSGVFSKPCVSVLINDPYLLNKDSIDLLKPYIQMASQHKTLKSVKIHTKKSNDFSIQKTAADKLNLEFDTQIKFSYSPLEHDRYIDITREDGDKARIILGRGFAFMQPDGSIKSTFIIIQDPVS